MQRGKEGMDGNGEKTLRIEGKKENQVKKNIRIKVSKMVVIN